MEPYLKPEVNLSAADTSTLPAPLVTDKVYYHIKICQYKFTFDVTILDSPTLFN